MNKFVGNNQEAISLLNYLEKQKKKELAEKDMKDDKPTPSKLKPLDIKRIERKQ